MHHSPSSLACAGVLPSDEGCERKWFYEHVERRREPDLPWDDRWLKWEYDKAARVFREPNGKGVVSSKQRSGARGTAVHSRLETYYEGGSPVWEDYIGQLALRMRSHLPSREACLERHVERSIGETPYPRESKNGDLGDRDRTCLVVDGIKFLGYVDLDVRLDPDGAEAKRLGLHLPTLRAGEGWWTFDYKTSRDVAQYALTPEEARTDPQGIIYPVSGMLRTRTLARGMRWVYVQTEGRLFAKPVDQVYTYEGSRVHLTTMVERARTLESKQTEAECLPNPDHCSAFGGCPHHVTRGGPCDARRKIGRIAIMGFKDVYLKAQAEKAANGAGAAAPAGGEAPAESKAEPTAEQPTAAAGGTKKGFAKKGTTAAPAEKPSTETPPASAAEVQEPAPPAEEKPEPKTEDKPKAKASTPTPKATTAAPVVSSTVNFPGDPFEQGERVRFEAMLTPAQLVAVAAALRG